MEKILNFCEVTGKAVTKYEGTRKYVQTGDIINNKIVSFEKVEFKNKPSRANQNVNIGDILFAKMKDTIKVIVIDESNANNIYSTGFFVVTPKQNVKSKYLYWLFNSNEFNENKNKNCKGATQKALNLENFSKLEVKKLPLIHEQERIINELDLVQRIIEIKKEQLEGLDGLIKSQFVEMFGNLKSNKFNWKKEILNDLCIKITDGKHGGCERDENSKFYFVGATEIENQRIDYSTAAQISKKDFEKDYARCNLEKGDLVIVNTGATIGKTAICNSELTEKTLLQKSVAMIKTRKEKILPLFLQYCYMCNEELYNKGQGCARVNLLISQIKNTEVIVPPIELQNQFADIVKQIDKQKFEIASILKEIETLYETLMAKYFE